MKIVDRIVVRLMKMINDGNNTNRYAKMLNCFRVEHTFIICCRMLTIFVPWNGLLSYNLDVSNRPITVEPNLVFHTVNSDPIIFNYHNMANRVQCQKVGFQNHSLWSQSMPMMVNDKFAPIPSVQHLIEVVIVQLFVSWMYR